MYVAKFVSHIDLLVNFITVLTDSIIRDIYSSGVGIEAIKRLINHYSLDFSEAEALSLLNMYIPISGAAG